ncbi:unnamed protein product, partial [Prorocentrum cordatum]
LRGKFVRHAGVDGKNYLIFEIEENATRDSELFLDEHLPRWEMWAMELHQGWTCTTRWDKVICMVFLETIEKQNWKLGGAGPPAPLFPTKFPTCKPDEKPSVKKETIQLPRSIEIARSDFFTKYQDVSAVAGIDAEEISRLFSMMTIANHLKPLCKLYELTQNGKKEEICDWLVAYILQQLGDAKPTETKPYILGGTVMNHFAQGCMAPECRAQRGIAKNEPIMKVSPYGWCHKMCAEVITQKEWAKFMGSGS